jgi:hypothetical protein
MLTGGQTALLPPQIHPRESKEQVEEQRRRDREIVVQGENHKEGSSYRSIHTKLSVYRSGATTEVNGYISCISYVYEKVIKNMCPCN